MMKTLVISRVFPPQVGGSGRWMWDLYSRLPRGEYVVAAGEGEGSKEFDSGIMLPVLRVPLALPSWGALGWRPGKAYFELYRRLCAIAIEHNCKRVHAATCLPEGFLAWMMRRRLSLPYLLYVHGEELNVARTSRELTWMTRRVLRGADAVVANSRNTAGLLARSWPVRAEQLRVLHPGVDTDWFRPAPRDDAARKKLGWAGRRVVLAVGRLQPRKGHTFLLRALAKVREAVPNVLCAIVGDGPERGRLQALVCDLGLQDAVSMLGELQLDDLRRAYQQCDLFVLANHEVQGDIEGFGIVLLEAQSCGKAVIAGKSGGTAEAVHAPESGLVLDCTDFDRLAGTILSLLLDHERLERMGAAARDWVVDHFDWKALCPAAQEIFGENASGQRGTVVEAVRC